MGVRHKLFDGKTLTLRWTLPIMVMASAGRGRYL
ncbi:hypothetical protein BH23GEM6_BH23GEM6_16240 [soil metagenome]